MKIIAAAMVRNECDIIEAFVRHHAALVDHIHILLHASSDPTAAILARLGDEGLALTVEHEPSVVLAKEAQFNALLARAVALHAPDAVLPLDADEFVVPAERAALERALGALPPGAALWLPWQTYLPSESDDRGEPHVLRRIRHRRSREGAARVKACFPRASWHPPEVTLVDGQHQLAHRDGRPIAHVLARDLRLAHFPVRSGEQFAAKIVVGWLSRQLSPDRTAAHSAEWRRWFDALRPGFTIDDAALPEAARAYYAAADGVLVDDPVPDPAPLRHAALIAVSARGRIVAQAEAMAALLGRTGASGPEAFDRAAAEALLAERAELRSELRQRRRDAAELAHVRARLARARRRARVLAAVAGLLALALAAALAHAGGA